jgi:hypothetical protein
MAITQADIDALDAAIVKGLLTVEVEGRRVTYQNLADMLKAKAALQAQLNRQITSYETQSLASFSRD